MRVIPLELQRRCEQRWAARFLEPAPTTPQRQFDRKDRESPAPGQAKTMMHLVSTLGFRSAPTG
jgi:hypothetical protein